MFNRRKSHRRHRLGMEHLEGRAMLAGDVVVEIVADDLFVTGDGASNEFNILLDESENVVVEGINGTEIVFDGKSAERHVVTSTLDRDLIIDTGGGDDVVDISDIAVVRSLRVLMRNGTDRLTVNDTSVAEHFSVNGGGGSDLIGLTNTFVGGGTNINGGREGDLIKLDNHIAVVSINVNGSEGNDNVEMIEVMATAANVSVRLDEGADQLTTTQVMIDSLAFEAGSGNDQWVDTESNYEGLVTADMDDGIDIVSMLFSEFESDFEVQLGAGETSFPELVELDSSTFRGNVELRGSAGQHELLANDSSFIRRLDAFFGGGDDIVSVSDSSINVTSILMGSGKDETTLKGNVVSGGAMIQMGGGVDILASETTNQFTASVTMDGGAGSEDTLSLGHMFSAGATLTGFETVLLAPNVSV
jgi:hypothetical protein